MKKIFIHIVFLVAMTSCTHYYYIPQTQNVPLFREKNEYRATVSMGGGVEISTIDIQAAYSFTDKFALQTNLMFANGGGDKNYGDWGKGNYIDAAFGYFKPLRGHGVFEIYAGLGTSNQHHQYSLYGESADLSFTKVYIQPSIGLTFSGFDVALTSGFSNINFNKINYQISKYSGDYSSVELISRNKNSFLFEPSLTIRGGWKYVKLQLQLGLSQNLSNSNLAFETSKINAGVTFAFGKRFGKKNTVTHTD